MSTIYFAFHSFPARNKSVNDLPLEPARPSMNEPANRMSWGRFAYHGFSEPADSDSFSLIQDYSRPSKESESRSEVSHRPKKRKYGSYANSKRSRQIPISTTTEADYDTKDGEASLRQLKQVKGIQIDPVFAELYLDALEDPKITGTWPTFAIAEMNGASVPPYKGILIEDRQADDTRVGRVPSKASNKHDLMATGNHLAVRANEGDNDKSPSRRRGQRQVSDLFSRLGSTAGTSRSVSTSKASRKDPVQHDERISDMYMASSSSPKDHVESSQLPVRSDRPPMPLIIKTSPLTPPRYHSTPPFPPETSKPTVLSPILLRQAPSSPSILSPSQGKTVAEADLSKITALQAEQKTVSPGNLVNVKEQASYEQNLPPANRVLEEDNTGRILVDELHELASNTGEDADEIQIRGLPETPLKKVQLHTYTAIPVSGSASRNADVQDFNSQDHASRDHKSNDNSVRFASSVVRQQSQPVVSTSYDKEISFEANPLPGISEPSVQNLPAGFAILPLQEDGTILATSSEHEVLHMQTSSTEPTLESHLPESEAGTMISASKTIGTSLSDTDSDGGRTSLRHEVVTYPERDDRIREQLDRDIEKAASARKKSLSMTSRTALHNEIAGKQDVATAPDTSFAVLAIDSTDPASIKEDNPTALEEASSTPTSSKRFGETFNRVSPSLKARIEGLAGPSKPVEASNKQSPPEKPPPTTGLPTPTSPSRGARLLSGAKKVLNRKRSTRPEEAEMPPLEEVPSSNSPHIETGPRIFMVTRKKAPLMADSRKTLGSPVTSGMQQESNMSSGTVAKSMKDEHDPIPARATHPNDSQLPGEQLSNHMAETAPRTATIDATAESTAQVQAKIDDAVDGSTLTEIGSDTVDNTPSDLGMTCTSSWDESSMPLEQGTGYSDVALVDTLAAEPYKEEVLAVKAARAEPTCE